MIIKNYFSETTFGDLPVGAIFHHVYKEEINEKYFIKTDYDTEWKGYLAVDLESGKALYTCDSEKVAPVECELRVKV